MKRQKYSKSLYWSQMKSLKEHPLFTIWLVILTILLAISFIKVKVHVTITSTDAAKVSVLTWGAGIENESFIPFAPLSSNNGFPHVHSRQCGCEYHPW